MTTVARDGVHGRLLVLESELLNEDGERQVRLFEKLGHIKADLRVSDSISGLTPLVSNVGLTAQGVIPLGDGFRLDRHDLVDLGLSPENLPSVVRPYIIGRDLVQHPQERWVIDFFGLSESEARKTYPRLWQCVHDLVKPDRDQNSRETRRRNWWLFGENQPRLRRMLTMLQRFIAVPDTSKFKPITFLQSGLLPDVQVYSVGSDDAWILGVLESRAYCSWLLSVAPRMGVGNDLRWKLANIRSLSLSCLHRRAETAYPQSW